MCLYVSHDEALPVLWLFLSCLGGGSKRCVFCASSTDSKCGFLSGACRSSVGTHRPHGVAFAPNIHIHIMACHGMACLIAPVRHTHVTSRHVTSLPLPSKPLLNRVNVSLVVCVCNLPIDGNILCDLPHSQLCPTPNPHPYHTTAPPLQSLPLAPVVVPATPASL